MNVTTAMGNAAIQKAVDNGLIPNGVTLEQRKKLDAVLQAALDAHPALKLASQVVFAGANIDHLKDAYKEDAAVLGIDTMSDFWIANAVKLQAELADLGVNPNATDDVIAANAGDWFRNLSEKTRASTSATMRSLTAGVTVAPSVIVALSEAIPKTSVPLSQTEYPQPTNVDSSGTK